MWGKRPEERDERGKGSKKRNLEAKRQFCRKSFWKLLKMDIRLFVALTLYRHQKLSTLFCAKSFT